MMSRVRMHIPACLALAALAAAAPARAQVPPWLPRYTLDIQLDVAAHLARIHQRVTWTNRHARPAAELVFNNHAHYQLPGKDIGMTAKMFEILRVMPGDSIDEHGHACEVYKATLIRFDAPPPGPLGPRPPLPLSRPAEDDTLPPPRPLDPRTPAENTLHPPRPVPPPVPVNLKYFYQKDSDTALVVPLPRPVKQGESVTVDLEVEIYLPEVQGRWGYWHGVTYLSNCLPVLAYYTDAGWQPTPYVVWHQPFFNEAGLYRARLTVAADQKVACTAAVLAERDLGDGRRQIDYLPCCARDFAIVCSNRFCEYVGQAGPVRVRCLAFPKHAFYAQKAVQFASEALAAFSRWFGPYPYPEFTLVESYFGWYVNECSGMLMIEKRMFELPHIAEGFFDYLVARSTCQQWWYNVVGTNGFAETWMDKGLVNYFAYRLMRSKYGPNDSIAKYPSALQWLPNVHRDDYRCFNLYGALGRGDVYPPVLEIPKFEHLANLWAMCYDRGGQIVGMIEHRLGPDRFLAFMQRLYAGYHFGMLRVIDFQRELEVFTGQPWDAFFKNWLYGKGLTDWCIESVKVQGGGGGWGAALKERLGLGHRAWTGPEARCRVTVVVKQKGDYNEPTTVGFCLDGGKGYQVRVPVVPLAGVAELPELGARVEPLAPNQVRVEVELPCAPTQIAVDPDQVLVDADPTNNFWKPRLNVRFTPCYTFLEENDLTNSFDRWNVILGPWVYAPTYDNPFFTRDTRFGVRAGAYRTAKFEGGVYAAYRTDYRDFVEGVDCILDHWPWNHTEVGMVFERRWAGTLRGENQANRGVVYGRYVIDYGDSLYLPPFQYAEVFTTIQDDLLPFARETVPGAQRFQHQTMGGAHYHINYLTPYWDAQGGFQFDLSYAGGLVLPGEHEGIAGAHQVLGQFSFVECLPDGLGWFSDTRLAFRAYGAYGLPDRVQYFALGGGEIFRGFDLAQRQGSAMWVTSVEWRVPILKNVNWGCCDRALVLKNLYGAAFCDVGDVYLRGQQVGGGVAEAAGAGLRLDLSCFTFVERAILRLDMARTVNADTPMQYWIGVEHPF